MQKKILFILVILLIILLNTTIIYATKNATNMQNYFRIHIVANSDSIDDQILKYQVAKDVSNYISKITINADTKEDYIKCINNNIYNILNVAKNSITKHGYNYPVYANIGNIYYDEKTKNNVYMQAGIYDSLQIIIGNGDGENWWSLLFPNSIDGLEISDTITNNNITFESGILNSVQKILDRFNF